MAGATQGQFAKLMGVEVGDAYLSSLKATLGRVYKFEATLGIGAAAASEVDGGDDPFAPSLLDEALADSEAAAASEETLGAAECSEGIEGDADYPGVDPPEDEPSYLTPEHGGDLLALPAEVAAIQTDLGQVKTDLDAADAAIDSLQSDVGDLKTGAAAAQEDIQDLKADTGNLQTAVQQLQAQPPYVVSGLMIYYGTTVS